jgi:molybdopterin/thiamine biosynthesis adenylyltransferase
VDRQSWLDERDSRSLRYSGRRLDPARWITLGGDARYLHTFEGQVAALTASNLLSRMTPSVALALPSAPVVQPLPSAGRSLPDVLLAQMFSADPEGNFCRRPPRDTDVVLYLGPDGPGHTVHGLGWDSYIGSASSPLRVGSEPNPFGAGLASIIAVARLFLHRLDPPRAEFLFNAFDWGQYGAPPSAPPPFLDLGELWFPGVGSVGTAALYFLTLVTRAFSAALFDMDEVKVHNLDRSPIFTSDDAEHLRNKAIVGQSYLRSVGVDRVVAEPYALHESDVWLRRPAGRPDVIVSAANELNVRNFIEEAFPPVQLYATTGKNWQATLIRHIPIKDPCSLCLFPSTAAAPPTQCATGAMPGDKSSGEAKMDAALPFLSFGAGLMVAAELVKLPSDGYPYAANRIFLQIQPEPALVSAWLSHRQGCFCHTRSPLVHRRMIAASRYEALSK